MNNSIVSAAATTELQGLITAWAKRHSLVPHMTPAVSYRFEDRWLKEVIFATPEVAEGLDELLAKPIEEIGIAGRYLASLNDNGVTLVGDAVRLSEEEILLLRNSGKKTLHYLREGLQSLHLSVGMVIPTVGPLEKAAVLAKPIRWVGGPQAGYCSRYAACVADIGIRTGAEFLNVSKEAFLGVRCEKWSDEFKAEAYDFVRRCLKGRGVLE